MVDDVNDVDRWLVLSFGFFKVSDGPEVRDSSLFISLKIQNSELSECERSDLSPLHATRNMHRRHVGMDRKRSDPACDVSIDILLT
jgi:hypothetical protein